MHEQKALCWSVSALVHAIADTLKLRFSSLNVRGEISSFSRASSGHCYFTLKDKSSQIRCAMFQRTANMLSFEPAHGDEVEIQGRLAVYEQRGELQLIVESMRPVGQGQLLEQFQQLKAKLSNEGLFDTQRKRPIPKHPQTIGVISSMQAAALHDILTALQRRSSHVHVIIYPASVQGRQATSELVNAINIANRRQEVDTLLICRGGGSLEDLWCFNEEAVVRAIAQCSIPVISGVGHETDFTLTDFVADLRAPTPTAAAELAAQPRHELIKSIDKFAWQLARQVRLQIDQYGQRLDHAALTLKQPSALLHRQQQRLNQAGLAMRMSMQNVLRQQEQYLAHLSQRWPQLNQHILQQKQSHLSQWHIRWQQQAPVRLLQDQRQQASELSIRLHWQAHQQLQQRQKQLEKHTQALNQACYSQLQQTRQKLQDLNTRLQALNPSEVLSRGYAWITNEQGKVLTSTAEFNPGQQIQAQFSDGSITARIEQVVPELLQRK